MCECGESVCFGWVDLGVVCTGGVMLVAVEVVAGVGWFIGGGVSCKGGCVAFISDQ